MVKQITDRLVLGALIVSRLVGTSGGELVESAKLKARRVGQLRVAELAPARSITFANQGACVSYGAGTGPLFKPTPDRRPVSRGRGGGQLP